MQLCYWRNFAGSPAPWIFQWDSWSLVHPNIEKSTRAIELIFSLTFSHLQLSQSHPTSQLIHPSSVHKSFPHQPTVLPSSIPFHPIGPQTSMQRYHSRNTLPYKHAPFRFHLSHTSSPSIRWLGAMSCPTLPHTAPITANH